MMKKPGPWVGLLIGLGVVVALMVGILTAPSSRYLEPPSILAGAVRVDDADGGRLYFLSSQWEKRRSIGRSSTTRATGWLHVDLWAFDAATARPLSRRRIKRDDVHGDFAALGVDRGVLWARIPELVGIRLRDGTVVADTARIAARNPALATLLPKPPPAATFLPESMQPLKFHTDTGLVITLADARRVRIDPASLDATPWIPPARPAQRDAPPTTGDGTPPDRIAVQRLGGNNYWQALVRGLYVGGDRWLGLLAEAELADLQQRHVLGGVDYNRSQRLRLYRAEARTVEGFFGKSMQLFDPAPLPESPVFVLGGLLIAGDVDADSASKTALWQRDPDSVFVLSRDRIDREGHLQLTRIAGPAGRVVWSAALPLSELHAWLPAQRHALMIGPDFSAPLPSTDALPGNDAMQIVSIDLAGGAVQSFDLGLHRDWPVTAAAE